MSKTTKGLRMRQYNEYKNSGVRWIGEIPSHWNVQPFGRHFSYGKGLPITKADLKPSGTPVISYGQIHSKLNKGTSMDDELLRFVDESYLYSNPQSILQYGDFIFADTSEDVIGAGNCAYNDRHETIFAGYHTVTARPLDLAYGKYYAYLFQANAWKRQIQSLVNGVKVYSINKSILKKSFLLFPPESEQQAIVSFLDKKVSDIDTLVSKTEKQIELLKEWKQAEVARVVTKGLDANAKMKDSGISWIGEMPGCWNTVRLSQIAHEYFVSNKNIHHQNLLSLSYGAIVRKDIKGAAGLLPSSFDNYQVVKNGIIVLRLTDLQNDHTSLRVGLAKEEGIVTSAYLSIEPTGNILSTYLYLQLHTNDIHKVFYGMGEGIRQSLNWQGIRNLKIVLPPLFEQEAIVRHIESITTKVDKMIVELTYKVEYLNEYRQRLISDVVTGKINVQPA